MRNVDATKGPLLKSIVLYTIPLVITSIVQELFTAVDKAVLGNLADTTAVASVGLTGIITSILTVGFIGISSGAGTVLARYVGQRDGKRARDTMNTALLSSLIFGAIVAALGYFLSPALLRMVDCPDDCYPHSLLYVRIYFLTAPIMLFYNYGASILRTLGDTKGPLTYIMIGGAVNVVLNIILCIFLPWKVAAVAIATAVSNLISAVLILLRLLRFEGDMRLSIRDMRFKLNSFILMIKFGIPAALSALVTPIANIQIASAINSFGVDAVAGNSAAITLQSLTAATYSGFGVAAMTFMGQNIGAEHSERVRKSFWYCLIAAVAVGQTLGIVFYIFGEFFLGIILGSGAALAIEYGMVRLLYIGLFSFLFVLCGVLGNALQAYGYPFFGSINSIIFTLLFRVAWMRYVYPLNPVYSTVMLCFTVSNLLNALFYAAACAVVHVRYKRGIYKKI